MDIFSCPGLWHKRLISVDTSYWGSLPKSPFQGWDPGPSGSEALFGPMEVYHPPQSPHLCLPWPAAHSAAGSSPAGWPPGTASLSPPASALPRSPGRNHIHTTCCCRCSKANVLAYSHTFPNSLSSPVSLDSDILHNSVGLILFLKLASPILLTEANMEGANSLGTCEPPAWPEGASRWI